MRKEFSTKTKALAFQRANGRCEKCGYRLTVGKYHYDHTRPDGLTGLLILITVVCFASVAIAKRQEKMLEELLRRSECRPATLELSNPVTRSQAAKLHLGSGN